MHILHLTKRTCLLTQTSLISESRLLARSPRMSNPLRCLLIRVARPISMCLRVQARSVTRLLSGTFIVNKAYTRIEIIFLHVCLILSYFRPSAFFFTADLIPLAVCADFASPPGGKNLFLHQLCKFPESDFLPFFQTTGF